MVDWSTVSIISIIINIILVPLIFFKSAINEILKEWWLDRRRKKEEAIKRLVEFKTKFTLYNSHNGMLMVALAQKQLASIMGRAVDAFIEEAFKSSSKKSGEASGSIAEFVDFLPAYLKTRFNSYNKLWGEIIRNIVENRITKEDLMGYNEKMTSLTSECINLADSMIEKNLVG